MHDQKLEQKFKYPQKKFFSSFLKDVQLPEFISDLRLQFKKWSNLTPEAFLKQFVLEFWISQWPYL